MALNFSLSISSFLSMIHFPSPLDFRAIEVFISILDNIFQRDLEWYNPWVQISASEIILSIYDLEFLQPIK